MNCTKSHCVSQQQASVLLYVKLAEYPQFDDHTSSAENDKPTKIINFEIIAVGSELGKHWSSS